MVKDSTYLIGAVIGTLGAVALAILLSPKVTASVPEVDVPTCEDLELLGAL